MECAAAIIIVEHSYIDDGGIVSWKIIWYPHTRSHGVMGCNSNWYFCIVTKLLEGFIIMEPNNLEIKIVFAAICGTQFSNSDFRHESI